MNFITKKTFSLVSTFLLSGVFLLSADVKEVDLFRTAVQDTAGNIQSRIKSGARVSDRLALHEFFTRSAEVRKKLQECFWSQDDCCFETDLIKQLEQWRVDLVRSRNNGINKDEWNNLEFLVHEYRAARVKEVKKRWPGYFKIQALKLKLLLGKNLKKGFSIAASKISKKARKPILVLSAIGLIRAIILLDFSPTAIFYPFKFVLKMLGVVFPVVRPTNPTFSYKTLDSLRSFLRWEGGKSPMTDIIILLVFMYV